MSNYPPDYRCNCGHAFNTKHSEQLDLMDSGGVLIGIGCPKCAALVSKENRTFLDV